MYLFCSFEGCVGFFVVAGLGRVVYSIIKVIVCK